MRLQQQSYIVAAAIIYNSGSYFACQRGYGDFEGLWEFPGGKIEPDESPEDALKREVQEELGIDIAIDEKLCTTEYDYPSFHLKLHCYLCSIISGELNLENITPPDGSMPKPSTMQIGCPPTKL